MTAAYTYASLLSSLRMQLDKVRDLLCTERPKTGGPNIAQQQYATIFRVIQTTLQEMNNLLFVLRPLASTVASLTEHARQRNMTELQWHYNDLRDHILTILDYVASLQVYIAQLGQSIGVFLVGVCGPLL